METLYGVLVVAGGIVYVPTLLFAGFGACPGTMFWWTGVVIIGLMMPA